MKLLPSNDKIIISFLYYILKLIWVLKDTLPHNIYTLLKLLKYTWTQLNFITKLTILANQTKLPFFLFFNLIKLKLKDKPLMNCYYQMFKRGIFNFKYGWRFRLLNVMDSTLALFNQTIFDIYLHKLDNFIKQIDKVQLNH